MNKFLLGVSIGLTMIAGASCTNGEGPENNQPLSIELTRSEQSALRAINDFSFDLMRATENRYSADTPNYVISPQSAAWTISMLANGAEPGTETLKELTDVLRLGDNANLGDVNDYSSKLIAALTASKRSDIAIANAVHYQSQIGIQQDFLNELKTFYNIGVFTDASNYEIDSWIAAQTRNMVKDFAKTNELDEMPFGVLNTMWFNGLWSKEFDPENTKKRDFHNADGTVSHPMMMQQSDMYGYRFSNEICHFLKIEFKNRAFAINFLLPAEGHDLGDVALHLNESNWKAMIDGCKENPSLNVMMPRLNLKNNWNLIDVAKDMGIKKAFSLDSELHKISTEGIMLSKFLNTSVFELNEKGAKASTVSSAEGWDISVAPGAFYLDEPFYFFITEESTGAILFLGRVSQL